MSLPSIWVEFSELRKESIVIAGFYREWNHKGDKSSKRMEILALQIEKVAEEIKKCIVKGDANLCASKEKEVFSTLKKLNKKKSSGVDGLSQEQLILGASNLASLHIPSTYLFLIIKVYA